MSAGENDPDTLQLLDELDADWAKRWRKEVSKNKSRDGELTFKVLPSEKIQAI